MGVPHLVRDLPGRRRVLMWNVGNRVEPQVKYVLWVIILVVVAVLVVPFLGHYVDRYWDAVDCHYWAAEQSGRYCK